jgi:hypothetical protein
MRLTIPQGEELLMRRTRCTVIAVLLAIAAPAVFAADLAAIADTNTDSASPNANLGSNGVIAVSAARVALIRFDAAQVAQSAGNTATLKMKLILAKNNNNGLAVKLVTGAWNEKTVTAATLPPISSAAIAQVVVPNTSQGTTLSFDVSSALAAWRSNPATNFGLAIVSTSPAANVQLGSREGGNASVLTVSSGTGPTPDNDVTVSATGGDYKNPLDAVNNATQGDKWCDAPVSGNPCVIHIKAGVYPITQTLSVPLNVALVGEEKGETILLSNARNNTLVGVNLHVSDLTVIARRATAVNSQGDGWFERVSLRSEGAAGQLGTAAAVNGNSATFIDSDVISISDSTLATIGGVGPQTLTLIRTHVSAISTAGEAYAVDLESDFRSVSITDSTLTSAGQSQSAGLKLPFLAAQGVVDLTRTTITTASSGSVSYGVFGSRAKAMNVIDSHIVATPNGVGIEWVAGALVVDNSTIDGSTYALDLSQTVSPQPVPLSVLRSQLTGDAPIYMNNTNATIDKSVLRAVHSAVALIDSKVAVTDSQLAGLVQLEGNSSATCSLVFDGNLALRTAKCAAP